uniref:Tight junction protein ZO-2 n=1 Tax=Callorhinchus milii TaxID=7868 RepID=A0A4W3GPF4_CALMI
MSVRFLDQSTVMEEIIWEPFTVTLHKDPRIGFGIAISGGRDKPNPANGDPAILVTDVVPQGPAFGKMMINDKIIMVNGVSMENVTSFFSIQTLKSCGKAVNIIIKRSRKVVVNRELPANSYYSSQSFHSDPPRSDDASDEDEDYDPNRNLRRAQNQNLYADHPNHRPDYNHHNHSREPSSDGSYDRDRSSTRSYERGRSPTRSYGRGHSPTRSYDRGRSPSWSDDQGRSPPRSYDQGINRAKSYDQLSSNRGYDEELSPMRRAKSHDRGLSPRRSDDRGHSSSREYTGDRERYPKRSHHDELDHNNSHSDLTFNKPIQSVLVKQNPNEEYGLRLGSQVYIKHMSPSGLATKDGVLQEGDIILKINGIVTENISLEDTRTLIEKSEGKLALLVLRDKEQFLVNIPELADSDEHSSGLEDISDLEPDPLDSPDERRRKPVERNPERETKNNERLKTNKADVVDKPTAIEPLPGLSSVSEDPIYSLPVKPSFTKLKDEYNAGYSPDMKMARFTKDDSVGLQLAGGNDVGIFVSGVQDGSPAGKQGIQKGDQILKVNNVNFQNLTREEAILFLLDIPRGEQMEILAQSKQDIYTKMMQSNVGDSFHIRAHFEHEADEPRGLTFSRGEVFRVVDTMFKGKLGTWLAVRIGHDLKEQDRGTIPNKSRAEQIVRVGMTQKIASSNSSTGPRAEFWKMRGLRGAKKNLRKSRDDLSNLTIQSRFPPYEHVALREASFKRPIVILGPISDVAIQTLADDLPIKFELAQTVRRNPDADYSSSIIKLETVKFIAQKDKHGLLDITPPAIERLNYVKWYPIVVFFNPENRQEVKAVRQRLCPESKKSSKRLYTQAVKLRKHWSHLFTATINLNSAPATWFSNLASVIKEQQSHPVWFSEEKTEEGGNEELEILKPSISMDYLSCDDSRMTSDYEDTDAEGGGYTDNELDDYMGVPAISRSSEPVRNEAHHSPVPHTRVSTENLLAQVQPRGQYKNPQYPRSDKWDHRTHHNHGRTNYSSDEDDWNGPATEL